MVQAINDADNSLEPPAADVRQFINCAQYIYFKYLNVSIGSSRNTEGSGGRYVFRFEDVHFDQKIMMIKYMRFLFSLSSMHTNSTIVQHDNNVNNINVI
jgi:hypothetical protein